MKLVKIILLLGIFLSPLGVDAQSIKSQAEQNRRAARAEQQRRAEENAEKKRIRQAHLTYGELISMLEMDIEQTTDFLSNKGYELFATEHDDEYDPDAAFSISQTIKYAFEKESYGDKALCWLNRSVVHTDLVHLMFQTSDLQWYKSIKDDLQKNGFGKVDEKTTENKITLIYSNQEYYVELNSSVDKYNNRNTVYNLSIFNLAKYHKILAEQEEQERLEQEALKRDSLFNHYIYLVDKAIYKRQYRDAERYYNKALSLNPQKAKEINGEISENLNIIYTEIECEKADSLFSAGKFDEATAAYKKILRTQKYVYKTGYIAMQINEIADLKNFLIARKGVIYDYKKMNPSEYGAELNFIQNKLHYYISTQYQKSLQSTQIHFTYSIDTVGTPEVECTVTPPNPQLQSIARSVANQISLTPIEKKGFIAASEAKFDYDIAYTDTVIEVRLNKKGELKSKYDDFDKVRYDIWSDLSSFSNVPGKYTYRIKITTINRQSKTEVIRVSYPKNARIVAISESRNNNGNYSGSYNTNYGRNDGPVNALYSLLVPGLGDYFVTDLKYGFLVTLSSWGAIGAGIGCYFDSKKQYGLYENATTQSLKDKYYRNANFSNKAFYAFVISGGVIWLSDVIFVWALGKYNKNNRGYTSLFYHPETKATGLSYIINI